jgi:hypothetical protein
MIRSLRSDSNLVPDSTRPVMPMLPSGAMTAEGILKIGKIRPWRSYVSAERLSDALRFRLGCQETGERGPACSYWLTPNGLRFRVDDPITDCASAPVMCRDGSREFVYSHAYASRLLRHVNMLIYGWTSDAKKQLRFV